MTPFPFEDTRELLDGCRRAAKTSYFVPNAREVKGRRTENVRSRAGFNRGFDKIVALENHTGKNVEPQRDRREGRVTRQHDN